MITLNGLILILPSLRFYFHEELDGHFSGERRQGHMQDLQKEMVLTSHKPQKGHKSYRNAWFSEIFIKLLKLFTA